VSAAGVADPARSKNLSVTPDGSGGYCVQPTAGSGINASTTVPVATAVLHYDSGTMSYYQTFIHLLDDGSCSGGWKLLTSNLGRPMASTYSPEAFTVIVP
jgi:hypothetical protein